MSKTKSEVAQKVLEKLYVVESGVSGDSADITIVEDKYDSWYYVMSAKNQVSWGSGDSIPTEAVDSVVSIVANACLTEFAVPPNVQQIVMRDAMIGEDNLKILEHQEYVPDEPDNHCY